jgi:hypothetical protein
VDQLHFLRNSQKSSFLVGFCVPDVCRSRTVHKRTSRGRVIRGAVFARTRSLRRHTNRIPEQAVWEEVASYASHIFGVTLQPLPKLASLQKLDTQIRELASKHSGEVANYLGKLSSTLSMICGSYSNLSRFKTASRMNALCIAIQQTRKPLDLFETMHSAKMETSPVWMGVVFKQAAAIHQTLDQVRIDVFERLGQVQDEPRASVAQDLQCQIEEALEADEHVTSDHPHPGCS